jgi:hypothetical protein
MADAVFFAELIHHLREMDGACCRVMAAIQSCEIQGLSCAAISLDGDGGDSGFWVDLIWFDDNLDLVLTAIVVW